ncbi:MAG TPA: ISKra4 family transposase [Roseiflexaceae bacterium]
MSTIPPTLRDAILTLRRAHPGWGPTTVLAELRADPAWHNHSLPSRSRIAALFKHAKLTRRYSRHSELPTPKPTTDAHPHDEWELDAQGWMLVDGIGKVCLVNVLDVTSRLKVESYPCLNTTNPPLETYQLTLRRAFLTTGLPRRISFECDQSRWRTWMDMRQPETLNVIRTWSIMRKNHRPLLLLRCLMTSNVSPIVQQIQQDFQALLTYVSGPEAHAQTAYTVELTLFRRLLALGAALLRLFFLTRAATRPPAPATAPGTLLAYHDRRPIAYYSIFGKLTVARHYFYSAGAPGQCPLDAALSLPEHCYSDLLREWTGYDATDGAYRETSSTVAHILGLDLSIQALETSVRADARDVVAFYDQPPSPHPPLPLGTIVVAQADGKGVPIVQPPASTTPVRLGKGQKRTKKKEAIVTALYTIAPYVRTPQDVLAALLHDPPAQEPGARPRPIGKELRATLDGKAAAVTKLAQRAALRDGPHVQDRVALTDGAEALQEHMQTHLPGYTLVLAIIHATEYLWDAANALLGETDPQRMPWVRQHLEQILSGQTPSVIAALQRLSTAPERTSTQVQVLRTTQGYYQRNLPYMRYDAYLARGWSIGTGVVEGACGHVVKDGMEQAGMRWTHDGAQALLDLRTVRINGDWDAYRQFHRQQQHQRLYGAAPAAASPEMQVLEMAA